MTAKINEIVARQGQETARDRELQREFWEGAAKEREENAREREENAREREENAREREALAKERAETAVGAHKAKRDRGIALFVSALSLLVSIGFGTFTALTSDPAPTAPPTAVAPAHAPPAPVLPSPSTEPKPR